MSLPLVGTVMTILLLAPANTHAQTWSADQQAVWKVVADSWVAIAQRNANWSDTFVHPNAIVWSDQDPMPRKRDAVKRWDTYEFANSTMPVHELSATGIVVQGSTAVAHYYYSLGVESDEGRRTTHGRCTDILVKESNAWKFIAWNCGDQESDDD